ncbi:MAG: alpha/beta fold hydrolase [Chloroflexi bacterium]|nr:alpha/beta fold hydrolase [Chloroflexota bacterium]
MAKKDSKSSRGAGLTALVSAAAGLAAGWIAYSRLAVDHQMELPPALGANRYEIESPRAGRLSYYVDVSGTGRPLVLLHAINAAASAFEMRPFFERYRGQRPVYALDLPGFGFSERSKREYTPELYTDAIIALLREVVQEPADVIALSLTGEFAARAALEAPDTINSLVLISPTGLQAEDNRSSSPATHALLSFPVWSQAFFDFLTLQPVIRYYLAKSFVGPVDDRLAGYAYRTAHQPGARYAPLAFVSGKLHTAGIRESVYEKLTQSVQVLFDQDPYTSFEALPTLLAQYDNWHAERVVPTRGLPHFEQMDLTAVAVEPFWAALETEPAPPEAQT